jgi:phosphotransferase system IIA component
VLRGSRVDSSIDKRDQKEKKGFSPFADPTDQLDASSRLRGVDIDELLRKARASKDGVVVLDNYEEQEQEEKIGDKKGANNNKETKEKAQASPQAKNKNKKEKNSGKVKTA